MNSQKIKELWNQAKIELDKDFNSAKKSINIPKSWDEMLREKFAELIVIECANVIDNSPGSLDDFAIVYLGNHFEVEQ